MKSSLSHARPAEENSVYFFRKGKKVESEACSLCQFPKPARVGAKEGFSLFECPECGLAYAHPLPSKDVLQKIYQQPSYFGGGGDFGYPEGYDFVSANYLLPSYKRRLSTLESLTAPGYLVDVGAANGMFVRLAQQHDWQATAIEMSDYCRQRIMQNMDVAVFASLEDAKLSANSIDAITMWEVLEHCLDYRRMIGQSERILKQGGILAISVPNYANARVQQDPISWPQFTPPEHIWYFDLRSLTRLLKEFGLVVELHWGETFVVADNWRSVAHEVRQKLSPVKQILPDPLYTFLKQWLWQPLFSFAQRQSRNRLRRKFGELCLDSTLLVFARKC